VAFTVKSKTNFFTRIRRNYGDRTKLICLVLMHQTYFKLINFTKAHKYSNSLQSRAILLLFFNFSFYSTVIDLIIEPQISHSAMKNRKSFLLLCKITLKIIIIIWHLIVYVWKKFMSTWLRRFRKSCPQIIFLLTCFTVPSREAITCQTNIT